MIRKHVDLIAIGVLLLGIAAYSSARRAMLIEVVPYKRIALSQSLVRAFSCHRTVRVSRAQRFTKTFAVLPNAPAP